MEPVLSNPPDLHLASWVNSTASTRRSPDSHFDSKLCGRCSFAATSTCVSPAAFRASRSRLRNSRYAADRLAMSAARFSQPNEGDSLRTTVYHPDRS